MKVLAICNHGNNRRGGMVSVIKSTNGDCIDVTEEYQKEYIKIEAIAVGAHSHTMDTLKFLEQWADMVIDMSDYIPIVQERLKKIFGNKYNRFDIGFDLFGSNAHPELLKKCQDWWSENKK